MCKETRKNLSRKCIHGKFPGNSRKLQETCHVCMFPIYIASAIFPFQDTSIFCSETTCAHTHICTHTHTLTHRLCICAHSLTPSHPHTLTHSLSVKLCNLGDVAEDDALFPLEAVGHQLRHKARSALLQEAAHIALSVTSRSSPTEHVQEAAHTTLSVTSRSSPTEHVQVSWL